MDVIEDFAYLCDTWENTRDYNDTLYRYFEDCVEQRAYLKRHFDVISSLKLGFGEKAFRYFWLLIFSQVPHGGKFLEIGVYKGSILALSQLISHEIGLDLLSYGLTPLAPVSDRYSFYGGGDYLAEIGRTFAELAVNSDSTLLIKGLSTDAQAGRQMLAFGPYDVIYVDGGHDYLTVVNDLVLANLALKDGGFLVLDDASCFLDISGFRGHADVSQAADELLESNAAYKHLFACGHNRVWCKVG